MLASSKFNIDDQRGFIHLFIPVVILAGFSLVALTNIQTTTVLDNSNIQGIIARNDNNKAPTTSNGNSSNNSDNPGKSSDEDKNPRSIETKIKQEITVSDEKPKTEIRENKVKTVVYPNTTTNKIKEQENTILLNTELEDGEEENEGTSSDEPVDDKDLDELRSISKFPLRIDLSTNQLIMTKNGVERVLTTLPAKAVQNMLRAHLKKGLGPKFFPNATITPSDSTPSATITPVEPTSTPSAEPTATPSATLEEEIISDESSNLTILENQISLEEKDGQVVYKIPAKKQLRLLGLIPVTTELTGYVSAQTGALIEEQESLLSRFLDLISP